MTKPAAENCASCHFGQPYGTTVQACHRNAPRPMQVMTTEPGSNVGTPALMWPAVRPDDWCGEWQAQRPSTPLQ